MALWISYTGVQFGIYGVLNDAVDTALRRRAAQKAAEAHAATGGGRNGEGGYRRPLVDSSNAGGMLQLKRFVTGATAGGIATVVTYPFDITRTTFAAQGLPRRYATTPAFAAHVLRTSGPLGLFRGMSAALAQIMPQMGLSFSIYATLTRHPPAFLSPPSRSNSSGGTAAARGGGSGGSTAADWGRQAWPAVAGAAAGLFSKLAIYPLDTVKKRVQAGIMVTAPAGLVEGVATPPLPPHLRNPLRVVAAIWRQEGPRALFRGWVPALWKSGLSTAITFGAYEYAKEGLAIAEAAVEEAW
ncbi:unnamed protein product [Phaeothamnion confervicola]